MCLSLIGITMLILNKDVNQFPCLLGHPAIVLVYGVLYLRKRIKNKFLLEKG